MHTFNGIITTAQTRDVYDTRQALTLYACLQVHGQLPLELQDLLVSETTRMNVYDDEQHKHGLWRARHHNGKLKYEIVYHHGLFHGERREWYINGTLRTECTYQDGKLEGLSRGWDPNGKLESEDYYQNGEHHGISRSWHANGLLERESTYEHGNLKGLHRMWYMDGQPKSEWMNIECQDSVGCEWHKNGQLHYTTTADGWKYSWYESGQKSSEMPHVIIDSHLERHGLFRRWYENGQLEMEGRYHNGKEHGQWTLWLMNGKVSGTYTYHEGKLLRE